MLVPEAVSPEVRSSTGVSDGINLEGSESCHRSICSADCNSAREIPDTKVPIPIPVPALLPQPVEREHRGAVPTDPRVQWLVQNNTALDDSPDNVLDKRRGWDQKKEEVCSCLVHWQH